MEFVSFEQAVEIWDTLRKPVNAKERQSRIEGKDIGELYPYYGATGQVGYIDGYISDGEYVLLGEDGAPFLQPTATKAYLIHGKAWVNNHAHVLRSKYNNAFLCYYLNSFDYQGFVSGTTRLKLTQAAMKQIPIPAPPLSEQKHIVSRIEELFSQLDASVAELKTAKERLKVYRQAVLKEAFDSCKDFVPLATLGDLGRGKSKHRPRNDAALFENGKYPFIQTGEVKAAPKHITCYSKMYGDFGLQQSKLWPKGTLCITIAANIAETAFLGIDACFPDSVVGFTPYEHILPEYVRYFIESQKQRLWAFAPATAQKNINLDTLEKLTIPYCSVEEQEQIVRKIDSKKSVCDSIEKTVDTALQQAEALRQSILKKAFEGRKSGG